MTNLHAKLTEQVSVFGKELRGAVAELILNNVDDHDNESIMTFMSDVSQYGCISGCVSGLIYYHETIAFFDEYHSFLEDILIEYGMDDELERVFLLKYVNDDEEIEEIEESLDISVVGEKNRYAWMMFEAVLSDMFNEYYEELAC